MIVFPKDIFMLRTSLTIAAVLVLSPLAQAQPPEAEHRISQFLPVENEPGPELIVDAPLAGPLARGAVIIPYRTKHFRILPIFGTAATAVSPRAGHLHVSVDSLPWRWADAGNTESVVVVGLPSGPHTIRIELANPEHGVLTGKTVSFVIPAPSKPDAAGVEHQH
jgi:hypothetical protein